jgi:HAE1 family hydrophobic/amphiphilic exporter-1
LTLQSPDTDELYRLAPVLEAKMREIPGLQDVTSDLQIANPRINVSIERDKAKVRGLSAQQIEDALFSAYGTRQISTIFTPTNTYKVILELLPRFQEDPAALSRLYVRSTSGALVPLASVTKRTPGLGPLLVNHLGQLPSVTISFNLKTGVALGDAVGAVDKVTRATLPATITTSFQGTAQAFQASLKGLGILLLMAILVIYIVLGILYESFVHPLTILSGLPSAGLGALIALMLFRMDLNLYGFVGVILLVGIVKKNAIMMIDFALEAERKEGKSPREAIHQGCLVRFRPIMMTTMSALMATLPIAIGFGTGAEARRPMGIAVVGGLLFSQLITLYLTPVAYLYLDEVQGFLRRRFTRSRTDS